MTTNSPGLRNSPWLAVAGGFALGIVLMGVLFIDPFHWHLSERLRGEQIPHPKGAQNGQLWTCGMHPQVIQDEPGQCPICHMDLTPLAAESPLGASGVSSKAVDESRTSWVCSEHPQIEESEPGECPIDGLELVEKAADPPAQTSPTTPPTTIRIDPLITQNMNLRTAAVERRDLRHPIRTVGYLEYDQERMVTVTTKYSGWVEKVHVNHVGEPVRKGQPLFEIYSPELLQTQQELLSARDFARRMADTPEDTRRRAEELVNATRTRLGYWDISPEQIAELEKSSQVLRTLTVRAPANGVVMKRMQSLEGMALTPGMETYHIANLSTLWLVVEIFEDQIPWIVEGTFAEVKFTYFPNETFHGAVRFIDPALSERTRTLRVRIEVPNRSRKLRAGMYATVSFGPQAAEATLAVPSEAVLRTGERNIAVVTTANGDFTPREVILGREGDGWAEVLAGLSEGEKVVTSAQFLLDSEASVRAAIRRMVATRGNSHSTATTAPPPLGLQGEEER